MSWTPQSKCLQKGMIPFTLQCVWGTYSQQIPRKAVIMVGSAIEDFTIPDQGSSLSWTNFVQSTTLHGVKYISGVVKLRRWVMKIIYLTGGQPHSHKSLIISWNSLNCLSPQKQSTTNFLASLLSANQVSVVCSSGSIPDVFPWTSWKQNCSVFSVQDKC